jgi:hypothetical protein
MKPIVPLTLCLLPLAFSCSSTSEKQRAAQDARMPDMSPEDMLARMAELGEPSAHHRSLDPLVGEFHATVKMWMPGQSEPTQSEGSISNRWVLGGRFLQGNYRGEFQGQAFDGLSFMGYDRAKERFVGTWMDTFSTMILPVSEGQSSEDGKTITMERDFWSPAENRRVHQRDVLTVQGNDQHAFVMYTSDPKGKEVKSMEILYTRVR